MTRGHYPKAYLRVDPELAFIHPDPGGFLKLLSIASKQPHRGRFKEWEIVENALGRALAVRLRDRGDVVPVDVDGEQLEPSEAPRAFCWYAPGWDEWQEGDWDVGERMRKVRERRSAGAERTARWRERHRKQKGDVTASQTVASQRHGEEEKPPSHVTLSDASQGVTTGGSPSEASGSRRQATDGPPTGGPASGERKPASGRARRVTPPLAAPNRGEPPPTPATPAEARAKALGVLGPPSRRSIDHDPDDELQAELARRCEDLAARLAERDGRATAPGDAGDALEVLRSVSSTPDGKYLAGLRYASREWLAVTLATCDEFERDELGQEPARGSAA